MSVAKQAARRREAELDEELRAAGSADAPRLRPAARRVARTWPSRS